MQPLPLEERKMNLNVLFSRYENKNIIQKGACKFPSPEKKTTLQLLMNAYDMANKATVALITTGTHSCQWFLDEITRALFDDESSIPPKNRDECFSYVRNNNLKFLLNEYVKNGIITENWSKRMFSFVGEFTSIYQARGLAMMAWDDYNSGDRKSKSLVKHIVFDFSMTRYRADFMQASGIIEHILTKCFRSVCEHSPLPTETTPERWEQRLLECRRISRQTDKQALRKFENCISREIKKQPLQLFQNKNKIELLASYKKQGIITEEQEAELLNMLLASLNDVEKILRNDFLCTLQEIRK